MRVLVINGSPSGEDSITLQTVLFIGKYYRNTEFEYLHAGSHIRRLEKNFEEAEAALRAADLLLFTYPVYTFLVPSQLHRFIELIKEHGVDLSGKYATQLTTSKHFYDTTAHQFIRDNCDDLGLRYITGLSADMEDLLNKKGQDDALEFFRYVLWNMKNGFCEPARYPEGTNARTAPDKAPSVPETGREQPETEGEAGGSGRRIAVIADLPLDGSDPVLSGMIEQFRRASDCRCDVVNIREFPFRGGCLGCFRCAADGTCVYKDGFDSYLRSRIQSADAIIYAYRILDHSMGSRFKMFDDRQFCNGHRTVTMGKPVGYLVEGDLDAEPNLSVLMEARAQVGGNFLAGIAVSGKEEAQAISRLACRTSYAIRHSYVPPKNFYGVGGLKIFRDLIYQMQGMMKEDHRFYKEHGFYDFPQKRKGTIIGMYLVGAMMANKKLSRKLGGKMTEGMLMPYKKVLERAEK